MRTIIKFQAFGRNQLYRRRESIGRIFAWLQRIFVRVGGKWLCRLIYVLLIALVGLFCLTLNWLALFLLSLGCFSAPRSHPDDSSRYGREKEYEKRWVKRYEKRWQEHNDECDTNYLVSTRIAWRTNKLWNRGGNAIYTVFRRLLSLVTARVSEWFNGGIKDPTHDYVQVHYRLFPFHVTLVLLGTTKINTKKRKKNPLPLLGYYFPKKTNWERT